MAGPRRIWILTGPALVILGLFGLVLARFWLASAPDLPAFVGARTPRFRELVGPAEFSPQALPLLGRVLDPGGDPVGEVLVYARPLGVPTWSVSDEQGRFRLDWPRVDGSEETPALLAISAWGFPPVERETRWQAEELEIRLPERESVPPPIPQPVPAPLAGRCSSARADDAPPFAWEVVLLPETPPEVFAGTVERRVLCAPDGSFALPDLAAGRYRVIVLPAWAAGGNWPDVLGRELIHEHDPLQPRDLQLELSEGAVTGTLADRRGRTIEGALLLLSDARQPAHLWPPATTDTRGEFRFEDLPAGPYELFVEAGDARLEGIDVEVRSGQSLEISVPPLGLNTRD